jgi:ATP-binding cassette, subfamily A (ABC1), member 3
VQLNYHIVFENFTDSYSDTLTLVEGPRLYSNQFFALLEKKILHYWRNLVLLFIQILIPVSFVSITIIIVRSWGGNKDLPKLELSLNTYRPTVTTIKFDPTTLGTDSVEKQIYDNYKSQFSKYEAAPVKYQTIVGDMIEHYLNISKEFLARVNNRYLFGISIEKKSITVIKTLNDQEH